MSASFLVSTRNQVTACCENNIEVVATPRFVTEKNQRQTYQGILVQVFEDDQLYFSHTICQQQFSVGEVITAFTKRVFLRIEVKCAKEYGAVEFTISGIKLLPTRSIKPEYESPRGVTMKSEKTLYVTGGDQTNAACQFKINMATRLMNKLIEKAIRAFRKDFRKKKIYTGPNTERALMKLRRHLRDEVPIFIKAINRDGLSDSAQQTFENFAQIQFIECLREGTKSFESCWMELSKEMLKTFKSFGDEIENEMLSNKWDLTTTSGLLQFVCIHTIVPAFISTLKGIGALDKNCKPSHRSVKSAAERFAEAVVNEFADTIGSESGNIAKLTEYPCSVSVCNAIVGFVADIYAVENSDDLKDKLFSVFCDTLKSVFGF